MLIGVGVFEPQREVLCIRERSSPFGTRAGVKQNLSSVVVPLLFLLVFLLVLILLLLVVDEKKLVFLKTFMVIYVSYIFRFIALMSVVFMF